MSPSALACPASLKGVLGARAAADALCEGLGEGSVARPVADGGEGTLEVLHAALGGAWRGAGGGDALREARAGGGGGGRGRVRGAAAGALAGPPGRDGGGRGGRGDPARPGAARRRWRL